jgi:hypothetical protein
MDTVFKMTKLIVLLATLTLQKIIALFPNFKLPELLPLTFS